MFLMSFACRSHFICIRLYFTYMDAYPIRMSVVCTGMSPVCHSYVLVCHLYVTRLWFYHEPPERPLVTKPVNWELCFVCQEENDSSI